MLKIQPVCLSVCLDINQSGTNRNRYTHSHRWIQTDSENGSTMCNVSAWIQQILHISKNCFHGVRATRPRHQGGAHGGRAPAKIVRAPAKITGLFMLKNRKRPNANPVLSVFYGGWSRRLSNTHSYPGCHAPDRLVVALADHGCSQYTSTAAYDY